MDTMSVSKASRLFWLGRYYERVATTLSYLWDWYDLMIDGEPPDYKTFCAAVEIRCVYKSAEEFMHDYVFDEANPESLRSAADAMLGNGMMLRETIGSRTLAYLELAVNALGSGKDSVNPTLPLQRAIDCIMAFRGSYDDCIDDENVRNIIKCGAGVERLSLCLRLEWRMDRVQPETGKLLKRMSRTTLVPKPEALRVLMTVSPNFPLKERASLLEAAESLFNL